MVHVQRVPPPVWIARVVIGAIGFAITGLVLYSDIKKRRRPTTQFYSNYLRWTSAVCIWCAPITPLFLILTVFPGFCMIRFVATVMTLLTQSMFLSFYQLSRLHYCFSNQQLHGNKGYPQWVNLMITIGIMIWISTLMVYILVVTLPSKCGYTDSVSLFYRFRERAILFDGDSFRDKWMMQIYHLWNTATSVSFHTWDLTILLLYLFKIYRIGKSHKSKEN